MTEFIMLVGIPACGKSTYAAKLLAEHPDYHVHSSDAIRKELFQDENDQEHNGEVFDVLHKRIKTDLKEGISCVYDATSLNRSRRIGFLQEISRFPCRKKCVVFFIPPEVLKQRNEERSRHVPNAVIDSFLKTFQCPYYYEGWDEIETVGGEEPYDLRFSSLESFSQDNPHHDLTLGEHLRLAGEYITRSHPGNDRLLCTCLAHDIGKAYTKTFVNARGEETDIAHYYGHECYGAYLYGCYWFSGKPESINKYKAYIKEGLCRVNLINWHMRPLQAWDHSEKAREKDRKLIGQEMYNDILAVHEADLYASKSHDRDADRETEEDMIRD